MADVGQSMLGTTIPDGLLPPDVSWERADGLGPQLVEPTADQFLATLYQWGPIQFQVWPLNAHEVDHETSTDWAHKEILGAGVYREWTGENDETLHFRGHLFPYRLGGMSAMERFETERRQGMVHLMLRGRGEYMGWFVCEKLIRTHTFLSSEGVGRQLAFESVMARAPIPDNATYVSKLWGSSQPRP